MKKLIIKDWIPVIVLAICLLLALLCVLVVPLWAEDCEKVEFKIGDFVKSSPKYHGKPFVGEVIDIYKRNDRYDLIHVCIDGEEDSLSAYWLVKIMPSVRKPIKADRYNPKITIKESGIAFEWIENGLHRQLWYCDGGRAYKITIMKERKDGFVDWKADKSYWDSDAIVNSNPWRQ